MGGGGDGGGGGTGAGHAVTTGDELRPRDRPVSLIARQRADRDTLAAAEHIAAADQGRAVRAKGQGDVHDQIPRHRAPVHEVLLLGVQV